MSEHGSGKLQNFSNSLDKEASAPLMQKLLDYAKPGSLAKRVRKGERICQPEDILHYAE